jgi:GDP-L-fucose synthase
MKKDDTILVVGASGLVGSAMVRKLKSDGYEKILTPRHKELDLIIQEDVLDYFVKHHPDYVFLCAAKVGGIMANATRPAEFAYQNQMIQNNVIHVSSVAKVKKLMLLGSSCIYPKFAKQPIKEEYLLTGPLEETNKAYAVAKIAGLITAKAYHDQYGLNVVCAMPTNLYGPNDNFDLNSSHVLPALIRKFHEAKLDEPHVTLWGTGTPRREFLYVDDLADALVFLMHHHNDPNPINVGTGIDIPIKDLALMIQDIIGYEGGILWDESKPDGTPRKVLDITKIRELGWEPQMKLYDGIRATYAWYIAQQLK